MSPISLGVFGGAHRPVVVPVVPLIHSGLFYNESTSGSTRTVNNVPIGDPSPSRTVIVSILRYASTSRTVNAVTINGISATFFTVGSAREGAVFAYATVPSGTTATITMQWSNIAGGGASFAVWYSPHNVKPIGYISAGQPTPDSGDYDAVLSMPNRGAYFIGSAMSQPLSDLSVVNGLIPVDGSDSTWTHGEVMGNSFTINFAEPKAWSPAKSALSAAFSFDPRLLNTAGQGYLYASTSTVTFENVYLGEPHPDREIVIVFTNHSGGGSRQFLSASVAGVSMSFDIRTASSIAGGAIARSHIPDGEYGDVVYNLGAIGATGSFALYSSKTRLELVDAQESTAGTTNTMSLDIDPGEIVLSGLASTATVTPFGFDEKVNLSSNHARGVLSSDAVQSTIGATLSSAVDSDSKARMVAASYRSV